jgi:DNA polymerase III subunit epsilon
MERCGKSFHAKTLCTVRLSQGMFPERAPHSLDAIIARHRLTCEQRHRALGDAQVLWEFLKVLKAQESHTEMAMLIKKIMRHPSLPAHLPSDQLERIPKTPGVYRFYGLNQHPLYIGKSICLRDRVSDHFCVDHRSERGMRLASEIRRIEWEQAAGDFGARLREIHLIKTEMPAHNVALRKKAQPWWIQVDPASSRLRYVPCSSTLDAQQTYFGPFPSKASVKHHITELARLNKLCLKVIGFEKSEARSSKNALPAPPLRPCFNFQIQKCLGACCGQETVACSAQRLIVALEPKRRPTWRWDELIVEEPSCIYDAPHLHRFRDWQWLGSRAEQYAGEWTMEEGAGFDLNIYHLLLPVLKDHPPDTARKVLGPTKD